MDMLQTEWGWQIAVYLFLGGLAAGTLFVMGLINVRRPGRFTKATAVAAWCAVACLGVGLLMLLADVSEPLRALMLWQSFSHFGSWMTIGAWLLFFGVICAGVWALAATFAALKRKKGEEAAKAGKLVRGLAPVAIVFGVCIAAYTGILLSVLKAHPLWNTALLPVLFTVSAIDTGVALSAIILVLCAKDEEEKAEVHARLEKWTVILVVAEIVVLVGLLVVVGTSSTAGAKSIGLLVGGPLAVAFWAFVVLGLLAPGAIAILGSRRESAKPALGILGNALCLAGGCALRFLILLAGIPVWM